VALRWHLLVIDDRDYFALRVWRYISRSIGIDLDQGAGPASREGDSGGEFLVEGKPYVSSDGEICFRWVRATGECRERCTEFFKTIPHDLGVYLLVDVKGEKDSGYNPGEICSALSQRKNLDLKIVSSYPSVEPIAGRPVDRKSLRTLQALRLRLYPKTPIRPVDATPAETENNSGRFIPHVLITGAGFEMADGNGGFGLPATTKVLETMGFPFRLAQRARRRSAAREAGGGSWDTDEWIRMTPYSYKKDGEDQKTFPILRDWGTRLEADLQDHAARENLDLYWDAIFGECLRRSLGEQMKPAAARDHQKSIALQSERRMREAFRKSLLEHDWGYMNQSLVAARLKWHAWLTTNYTKFADRAIDLVGDRPLGEDRDAPWRIISTAAEANISIREDLGSVTNDEGDDETPDWRHLFKLHGDIAHLHTMAIAGHDKDIINPLCFPVDSLYQIFTAADQFLRNSLWNKARHVVWHIVGHGMQDFRLFKLIQSVCSRSGEGMKHVFIIVNPKPEEPLKVLEDLSADGPLKVKRENFSVLTCKLYASEYMARIEHHGLSWFREESLGADLKKWQESLDQDFGISGQADRLGKMPEATAKRTAPPAKL
jgi:hypothetical protein